MMDGVLLVDKPPGVTLHDVVAKVNGLVSPSWVIASTALMSPIRKPNRAPGSK